MNAEDSKELIRLRTENRKLFERVEEMRKGVIERIKIDSGKASPIHLDPHRLLGNACRSFCRGK